MQLQIIFSGILKNYNKIYTYRLRIAIKGTIPLIWRLIEVPSNISLEKLHHILQLSFGWDNADASDIYGTFIAAAYLTPFMGGLLADLKLGYRFSIILGGTMMGIGYCMLAIPQMWAFYTALVIMVIGNGFFKPNISTLLGNMFNDPRYKDKKDTGYNIFYMGINIGAFICNFIGAIMLNRIGWNGAFMAAGI